MIPESSSNSPAAKPKPEASSVWPPVLGSIFTSEPPADVIRVPSLESSTSNCPDAIAATSAGMSVAEASGTLDTCPLKSSRLSPKKSDVPLLASPAEKAKPVCNTEVVPDEIAISSSNPLGGKEAEESVT